MQNGQLQKKKYEKIKRKKEREKETINNINNNIAVRECHTAP